MKKIIFSGAFFLLLTEFCLGQLTGIKNIPGDYPTVTAAVADLNLQGVGVGGVTFHVATGTTELITSPITITATGTSMNPILFQRWGAGTDPLIKRTDAGILATSVHGGAGDAVIRIEGTDYITFNGIDVSATNQGIEYGYLTHKPSGTDGCQHVTIQNSAITLTKGTSAYVAGIYIGNGTVSTSSATGVTVTAASGINSNITITGNTIQNVFKGIIMQGSPDPGFYDSDYTIGQAGEGNTIQNFGGTVINAETYGIYMLYVNNPTVAYNVVDNAGGGGTGQVYGIWAIWFKTVSGNVICNNNSITVSVNFAAFVFAWARYIAVNSEVTSITCQGNVFAAGTMSSRGNVYLMYFMENTANIIVSGNTISGTINKTSADGDFYCYIHEATIPAHEEIYNNNFSNITLTGISAFYGIHSNCSTNPGVQHVVNAYQNTISNILGPSTGDKCGIYIFGITNSSVYGNSIHAITGRGYVYGMYVGAGQGNRSHIHHNEVYNLTSDSWTEQVVGIYVPTGQLYFIYNNFISDLKNIAAQDINAIVGLFLGGGDTLHVYYNTIYLNATSSSTTTFGTSGIFRGTSSPSFVDLRNNVVVNTSTPGPTGGLTVAQRSAGPINPGAFALSSNNNDYFAGSPGPTHFLFYDQNASVGYQLIDDYKTAMAPRETACISALPPFLNISTTPYDLHMNTIAPTGTESGGVMVVLPEPVTNDFDLDLRWGETGYTGSGTAPDIGADEFNGTGNPCTMPVPGNTLATSANICQGQTITLSIQNSFSGSGYTFQWKSSTDNVVYTNITGATVSTYTFQPGSTGYYKCQVSCNPNAAASNPIAIVVNPLLPVSVAITATQNPVCQGTQVTLTANVIHPGALPVYQWTVNGLVVGANQPTYTYTPANNDLAFCTVTSSEQCTTGNPVVSNPLLLTVNPNVTVTLSIAASANTVCAGATVTFTATSLHGGTTPIYQWKVNGIIAGTNNAIYSYMPANGDIITCILTSSEVCTSINPVTSNPVVMVVSQNLTVSIAIAASPNPFCTGASVTFTGTPFNGGTSPSYQWKVNGANTGANASILSYNPAGNDSVQCLLTSNLVCVSGNPATSNKIIARGINPPVVGFTACFDTITSVIAKPFKLKGGIPLGGTYSGIGVNSATGVFTPATSGPGTKAITYSYSNIALCSASKTRNIMVQPTAAFTCGNNLTDIRDNKVYPTVLIGSQCWLGENLDFGFEISDLTP
ncbi:MAG: hypothetical protein WCK09_14700 [Bacteroidota bacterium]